MADAGASGGDAPPPRFARLVDEVRARAAARRTNLARSRVPYSDEQWRESLPEGFQAADQLPPAAAEATPRWDSLRACATQSAELRTPAMHASLTPRGAPSRAPAVGRLSGEERASAAGQLASLADRPLSVDARAAVDAALVLGPKLNASFGRKSAEGPAFRRPSATPSRTSSLASTPPITPEVRPADAPPQLPAEQPLAEPLARALVHKPHVRPQVRHIAHAHAASSARAAADARQPPPAAARAELAAHVPHQLRAHEASEGLPREAYETPPAREAATLQRDAAWNAVAGKPGRTASAPPLATAADAPSKRGSAAAAADEEAQLARSEAEESAQADPTRPAAALDALVRTWASLAHGAASHAAGALGGRSAASAAERGDGGRLLARGALDSSCADESAHAGAKPRSRWHAALGGALGPGGSSSLAHNSEQLRTRATRAGAAAASAAAVGAKGAATGCARLAASPRFRRALSCCGLACGLLCVLCAYPAIVLANHISIACAPLRLEGLRVEHMCSTQLVLSANVSIDSPSWFSVQIGALNATLLSGRALPVVSIAVGGDFVVRHGRVVYPARVEVNVLDEEEMLRTLRALASSLDHPSPLDEAALAAGALAASARQTNRSAVPSASAQQPGTFDLAGADARARAAAGAAAGAGAAAAPRNASAAADGGEAADGFWQIAMEMSLGSRVVLGRQLGGRVAFLMELSEAAALKMAKAIGTVQAVAGCSALGGLDFGLGEAFAFAQWPPELVEMQIGEVSKAGVHVSGTVQFDVRGPLEVDLFPALSIQLCSSADGALAADRAEALPAGGATGGAAGGGSEVGGAALGANPTGLGRASHTINRAVSFGNLNMTDAQMSKYRQSHVSDGESCIATIATQPFALVRGQPFRLSFDLAMPFYGNSSTRFYGPLYFAEEISRGGALIARGSSDHEIRELGGHVFKGTYVEQRARATSSCLLQRVTQQVELRAHLLRMLPDVAPYIKDALLGASCMAGVFLHYFSHDNSTALNDDRVLEDCFAFMESSVGIGLDPGRRHSTELKAQQHLAVRTPKTLAATFKPAVRDLSGRILYRFVPIRDPVLGARVLEGVACRWLNDDDASTRYFKPRTRTPTLSACESACIKLRDCWGINFAAETAHCELWNRVPRDIVPAEGYRCLALEAQGTAFAAPGDDPASDAADDGWLKLVADEANRTDAGPAESDATRGATRR